MECLPTGKLKQDFHSNRGMGLQQCAVPNTRFFVVKGGVRKRVKGAKITFAKNGTAVESVEKGKTVHKKPMRIISVFGFAVMLLRFGAVVPNVGNLGG
jgi:hypothetical protein